MSKRKQRENLATFIGLRAAHEILTNLTNLPESLSHLEHEIDTYNEILFELAQGNWNQEDIKKIKYLAHKRCIKKLREYKDIDSKKYDKSESRIREIMIDLGLM